MRSASTFEHWQSPSPLWLQTRELCPLLMSPGKLPLPAIACLPKQLWQLRCLSGAGCSFPAGTTCAVSGGHDASKGPAHHEQQQQLLLQRFFQLPARQRFGQGDAPGAGWRTAARCPGEWPSLAHPFPAKDLAAKRIALQLKDRCTAEWVDPCKRHSWKDKILEQRVAACVPY